jgi:hypothetical protein
MIHKADMYLTFPAYSCHFWPTFETTQSFPYAGGAVGYSYTIFTSSYFELVTSSNL